MDSSESLDDTEKEVIVGVVIGMCGATVLMVFLIFGVFQLFVKRDQGTGWYTARSSSDK